MISYHVFFTPKPEVEERSVIGAAHRFFQQLIAEKKLSSYRIMRVTNAASFQALPRYQAIADYESQQELDTSFAFMRHPKNKEEGAHGELMRMVTDFTVSFTIDVSKGAEQGSPPTSGAAISTLNPHLISAPLAAGLGCRPGNGVQHDKRQIWLQPFRN